MAPPQGRHRSHDLTANRRVRRPLAAASAAAALCTVVVAVVPTGDVNAVVGLPGVSPSPSPSSSSSTSPGPSSQAVSGTPAAVVSASGDISATPAGSADGTFTVGLPDERAEIAVRTALAQRGLPYVWGGDGPSNGDSGFDCSGLTTYSYGVAGVELPRTAHTQFYAGPHVPDDVALQPGDLLFYGTAALVHHVGMYIGESRMVNAPTFGKPVQVAYYRWLGDDYLGATRPAAEGATFAAPLPSAPADPAPDQAPSSLPSDLFTAPVAPLPPMLPRATAPQPPQSQTAATARAAADAAPLVLPPTRPTVVPSTVPLIGTTGPGTGPPDAVPSSSAVSSSPRTSLSSGTTSGTSSTTPSTPTTPRAPTTPRPPTTPSPQRPATTPSFPRPTTLTTAPTMAPPVPQPTLSATSPASPSEVSSLTFPDGSVLVAMVSAGRDGLPEKVGAQSLLDGVVVRLGTAGPAASATTGTRIVVRGPRDSLATQVASVRADVTTGEAAAIARAATADGSVVVLVPTGSDEWTVLIAR